VQLTVPDGEQARWIADEAGPFGRARVDYWRGGAIIERRRVGYTTLALVPKETTRAQLIDGVGRIVVAAGGWPLSVADDESLRVDGAGGRRVIEARSHLSLALVSDEALPPRSSLVASARR
jgi:hypothetical protein